MTREDIKVGQIWEWCYNGGRFEIINLTERDEIDWRNVETGERLNQSDYGVNILIGDYNDGYCKLVNPYTLSKFRFV